MIRDVYRYSFDDTVCMTDVDALLTLALGAIEGLYGVARLRLDVHYHMEHEKRIAVIDATSPVGLALNQIFVGHLQREFGDRRFTVSRKERPVAVRGGDS
ncbi:MAG: hypothetical protein D8M59_03815 [Planctomycetes bacterium]|nr:hypothetical protein [Planctomycetota bacterium]